jgi:NAD(P)-dependent dehydrogenase (short-subunit alcohol dehydrogenase family)
VHHDVSDESSWKSVIDSTLETFGKPTVLVNNSVRRAQTEVFHGISGLTLVSAALLVASLAHADDMATFAPYFMAPVSALSAGSRANASAMKSMNTRARRGSSRFAAYTKWIGTRGP